MQTLADVMEFRRGPEAIEFAKRWVESQRAGDVTSDWHMNLLAWTLESPFHVLGIVLNLIDLTIEDEDEMIPEMVALGPVEWLVEHSPEDFGPILRRAVVLHPGFATFTADRRSSPDDSRWARLNPPR